MNDSYSDGKMQSRPIQDKAKAAAMANAKKIVSEPDPTLNKKPEISKLIKKVTEEEVAKKALEPSKPKQGSQPGHYVTDSKNHTKSLTPSEKNFLEGQKLKEKIAKKTGVYPNTAN